MSIFTSFPVTNEEYAALSVQFENLAHYASGQLLKKNAKNNHTDELEDITQELRLSIIRAASYYKRQVYIERCLDATKNISDKFVNAIRGQLHKLWNNRTRHGANKVVFGQHQEELLDFIVNAYVPEEKRPRKSEPLTIDTKFITYCKAITWNCQKSMGKKITREKSVRTGMVSLSSFDYLGHTM